MIKKNCSMRCVPHKNKLTNKIKSSSDEYMFRITYGQVTLAITVPSTPLQFRSYEAGLVRFLCFNALAIFLGFLLANSSL